MPRRTRHVLLGLLLLSSATACSGETDEPPPGATPAAMDIATAALTASGATSLGAVGGDAAQESTASTTLPWGGTVGVFAACTGGGDVSLDLAGTAQTLDCDGQAHRLDDLVLPDDELPSFRVTEPNDEPSTWGVAFAQA